MTFEFTQFNPVIRSSKVKQSAFFPFHPVGRSVELCGAVPGFTNFQFERQLAAVPGIIFLCAPVDA